VKRTITAGALVAALALPLTLAACSGGDSGSGSDDATANADGKTLTIWDYESDDSAMGQAWAKAIEIFKQKHPGVTVKTESQTFEQIQKNAKIILTGDDVPDVMEYNKGNATAGQLASQGLLTPLTDVAKDRGWDKKVTGSIATTAQYDENGLMGSGDWYGIPNYGEYVTVYYNADMFKKYGVAVPTSLDEFTAALAKFKAAGVTPLNPAGAEYPLGQLWYQLALTKADRSWIDSYQLFKSDLDWQGEQLTSATNTISDWTTKGYIAKNSAGLTAEDMGTSFISGKYPIMVSGSWWFGRLVNEAKFDWSQFQFPGSDYALGSSGNLWVVPENAKNKGLAEDFIDITLSDEVQNVLGQKGGLPIAGDASTITDAKTKTFTEQFQKLVSDDSLAFYPDWPVAGFYDQIVSALQSVVNGSKSTSDVLTQLQKQYESGKDDLLNG